MSRKPLDKPFIQRMVGDLSRVSDKNVTLKILTKIRVDLSKCNEGIRLFRECKGIEALIPFIKRPSKRILDLALSILANCCTDAECVQQAMKLNVVPALLAILKSIPNQLILCRTCRLLGNLATDKKNAKYIQDGSLVTALASLLDEESNESGTLLMITRLVGKMWRLDSFQVDAYLYGIIKRITMVLVKLSTRPTATPGQDSPITGAESPAFNPKKFQRESNQVHNSMENNHEQSSILAESFQRAAQSTLAADAANGFVFPAESSQREVISCLLKCILLAASSKAYQFSEQVIKVPASLRCLLFYCTAESPFRDTALHIVSSVSYNRAARYEVGTANGVDIILNLLKNPAEGEKETIFISRYPSSNQLLSPSDAAPLTANEYKYCMNIICLLAGDSCNRAKIRYCGGMRILLRRFRDTENQSERDMILFGLSIFANDQMSVHLLVREGLINTLLHRMAIELDAMPEYHTPVVVVEEVAKREKNGEYPQPPKLKRKGSKMDPQHPNKFKRSTPFGQLSPSTSNSCYSDSMESPTSSSYGSMSNQSPSYSSYSSPANFDSDGDSATYSPVCSDPEDGEEGEGDDTKKKKKQQQQQQLQEGTVNGSEELAELYNEVADEVVLEEEEPAEEDAVFVLPADEEGDTGSAETAADEDDEEVESPEMKLWNKSVIKKMLVLLRDMRLRIRRVPDLARGDNLSTLLRACKSIPEPVPYLQLILAFIVQDTESFVNLLQTNFIIDLYNLRHPTAIHENCRLCSDMRSISVHVLERVSAIAESGYGRGELAHYLLTRERSMQRHVAMVTALVVRDPKFLYSLLFEHSALQIVMEEIMDESEGARSEEACLGITALAMNLNLYLEGGEGEGEAAAAEGSGDEEATEKETKAVVVNGELKLRDFSMKTESDAKITFLLSDGERIEFNEETLVSYSDVFNSMFSRDFQESKFKEVLISGVSAGGLKYFLQLVQHFQRNPEPRNYVHVPKATAITVALEAYELAIKYMLGDIEVNVLRHIKKLVDDTSVQDMLEWSMKNKNADMLEMSIYYFLNSDLPGPRKLRMFRRANGSQYGREWNHWIVDTIKTKCSAAMGLLTLTE